MKNATDTNHVPEFDRRDDVQFLHDIDALAKNAEDIRLKHMKQNRSRSFLSMIVGILSILAGSCGFGWFLFMQAQLYPALACLGSSLAPWFLLFLWERQPLKAYARHHKTEYMPQLARVLGGLRYYPSRGISAKIINRTGVVPSYDSYKAEDCFMGRYKGIKVILSEARLYKKKQKKTPVFDGIFVILEAPEKIFEGHTIITADQVMVKQCANTRWNKLQPVALPKGHEQLKPFMMYSDKPNDATLLAGNKLLKELSEAAIIFNDAPLTAVFFGGKFIFLTIPYEEDMFEASDLFTPIRAKQYASHCKKEIEQILEIIDVFDIYSTKKQASSPLPQI